MNGSRVRVLLYSVVLMGIAVSANEGSGANLDTTRGTSGTTGLTKADKSINQTSTKDFQSESTMPATLYTSATSGTNSPVNTKTPSRAYTKPSGQPLTVAQCTPCPNCLFEKKKFTILLIVTGCLLVLCTILLVSTVVLLCQVHHLKRQPCSSTMSSHPTRSNVDLVSGAGYLGTGQRTKERPGSEPSETSQMMAELRQTQEGEMGKEEEPEKEDKVQGKDETAKDTPKKEEKEAATANGTSGSAENGAAEAAGAATPSQESPVTTTTTTKQPAEPSDPAATTASPSSQASSDVVVG
ncbi:uncharacterized protein LOC121579913 [Coregonus clupeaformis]|uniref:uncharacterized protein LOC121579913 n=1 Tax=Coregonus clupeaformis TaxID=59861 RepID=UPI001BE101D5|nr:uncharacterized protein LOC121579913 [Coregonus clupeaformis]